MTFADYQQINAANFSTLKHILTSPAHYQAALKTEVEETIDMRLGSAVHEFVLEGKVRPYVIRPTRDPEKPSEAWHGGRKSCKAWRTEKESLGLTIYAPDEADRMFRMQKALQDSPLFQKLLGMCGEREMTVQADLRGVDAKARLDMCGHYNGRRLIVDLKKCQDASPRAWGKTAKTRNYDFQLVYYSALLQIQESLDEAPMVLSAVVEDSDAAPVVIYSVSDEMWSSGTEKMHRAITLLKQCREKDEWPSYGNGEIIAPEWPKWNDDPLDFGLNDEAA